MGRLAERETSLVVGFDRPTRRAGDTGEPIATHRDDALWRNPRRRRHGKQAESMTAARHRCPTVLELFAGAGGMALEMRLVGSAWTSSNNEACCKKPRGMPTFLPDPVQYLGDRRQPGDGQRESC